MAMLVVGDLVWRLRGDLSGLEDALAQGQAQMGKAEKKMGGILSFLTGKWGMMAGMATGAAYAMIRVSPSLSFAMEEVGYRFEYLLGVLGEEFAPLIEEILLPTLDALIPVVKEIAPLIGEFVGKIVEFFKKPEIQEAINTLITAFGDIVTVLWELNITVLDAILPILEAIIPVIADVIALGVALFSGALEVLIGWLKDVGDRLEGPLTKAIDWIADKWDNLKTNFIDPIIKVLEDVWDWIKKVADRLDIGGILSKAIKWIMDKLEKLWDWLKKVKEKLEDVVNLGKQVAGWVIGEVGGMPITLGPVMPGAGIPSFQEGGVVARTGLAIVHRKERIYPPSEGMGMAQVEVHIHMESVTISSDYDVRSLVEELSRGMRDELQRAMF